MKTILYRDLSDACRWNEIEEVNQILQTNNNIDLTYSEYKLFNFAIQNNNCKMLSTLIKYYESNQLSKLNIKDHSYYIAKVHLSNKLEDFVSGVSLSQEMKETLSSYIDFEGSENNDSFLEDEHLDNHLTLKEQIKFSTLKKSYSENDLHSTFDNSKENLLTEENLKRLSNNSSEEKFKFIEEFLGHHDTHDIKNDDLLQKEYHSDLAGNLHDTDEF